MSSTSLDEILERARAQGLLPADAALSLHAVSGYSGQGRAGVDRHEGPDAASAPAFELYGLTLQHKHVPEIRQHARLQHPPLFVPGYGHYRQGIVLTVPLHRRQLDRRQAGPAWARAISRDLFVSRASAPNPCPC